MSNMTSRQTPLAPSATSVIAVIVTYGSRCHLLRSALQALAAQTTLPFSVVIVDNGASPPAAECVRGAIAPFPIQVLTLPGNWGSAAGFKAGMEEALRMGADLIWLLDDDNSPHPDALGHLLRTRAVMDRAEDVFASLRLDRPKLIGAAAGNRELRVFPNAFLGVDLVSPVWWRRFFARPAIPERLEDIPDTVVEIPYGLYGGLLLPRTVIQRIGYPDERYVTYMDDLEFTCRIRRNGVRLWLVAASMISDLDQSWYYGARRRDLPPWIDVTTDPARVYYSVRNLVAVERAYFVRNQPLYLLNGVLYLLAMLIQGLRYNGAPRATWRRSRLLVTAFRDGLMGRLGRNDRVIETLSTLGREHHGALSRD